MNTRRYGQLKIAILLFIAIVIIFSIFSSVYLLTIVSTFAGLLFSLLVCPRPIPDEREIAIREKSAHITYAVFTPTVCLGALFLLIPYQKLSPVFANGEFVYLQSIGAILAYLSLSLIIIYAISYRFLNKKYGGSVD